MSIVTNITEARFAELVAPLSDLPVAAVWLGDYTALYVEVGEVFGKYDSGRPRAEYSVYLGFDWQFEAESGSGLSSGDPNAKARIADLLSGLSVARVVATTQFELELRFDSDDRIRSADGDSNPEWSIYLPLGSCIGARADSLVVETEPAPVLT